MIKLAIIDDHKLFRQGLALMLEAKEEILVVNKFETAIDFLKDLPDLDLDLILLDIDMPGMDGITAIPEIRKIKPEIKIIMLSMHLNAVKINAAKREKANGYLVKTSGENEVEKAILTIANGGEYYTAEVLEELASAEKLELEKVHIDLTPRELDILRLVCKGDSSQEIADELDISVHTADTHRRNLLNKTGCKNAVGLLQYAIENQLL